MAVLPESMDRLDVNDAPGSFAKIQDYIRYMGERIEFSMRNMTKTVSAAGVSSAEIYILYQAQAQQLAALTSTVNGIAGNITSLQRDLASITERLGAIAAWQASIEAWQATVTEQQGALAAQLASVTAQLASIDGTLRSLDARVSALETAPTT